MVPSLEVLKFYESLGLIRRNTESHDTNGVNSKPICCLSCKGVLYYKDDGLCKNCGRTN